MRLLKIWIFASIYMTIFKIYYANGIEIIDQLPNNWVTTNSFEPPIDYPESCPRNTNKKQAKPRKGPPYDGSENRMLKRSRKGKKIRRKKSKKNKKRKSALMNNNANKNYAKNKGRPYKLTSDYPLDSDLSILEDDDLGNSILESDLLDDTLDSATTDDLSSVDSLDTSFDMADPYNDIEPLDELSTTSPLDTDDLTESTKKYWDEDLVEPEYVISEWFAILDGKKFDKSSSTKFPYVSDGESDYSDTYISDKTQNSGHLINSYSSGSMYTPYDTDNEDYVKRINVDPEDLYMIHPDTGEDIVENRILEKRQRERSRTGRGNTGYGRLKRGKRRNRGKGRSGIYDVQKAFETDVPVETGTYRRFDEDEIERYGLMKNTHDIAPSDNMAGLYTGETDLGPIDPGIMDIDDPVTQSGYDVSDVSLGDSPYLSDPVDNLDDQPSAPTERLEMVPYPPSFDSSSEYLPFDQIISNDYDDFGPSDDPKNPYNNRRQRN
ncbi:hypothetical protein MACK_000210 [Theileria orientalis]|uniref:Uncharacterized protein n=1 Tax=Theileria orientalis TaxID=68886 RepID=A0A976M9H5_THEOR|nr:hypothetical protein MACK_000210 [Theileria orientalis]